jgi:hypothetical protein
MIDTSAPGCDLASGGTDCGTNVQTKSGDLSAFSPEDQIFSEMAHLYYVTLGNVSFPSPGYGLVNTGEFLNFRSDYWFENEYAPELTGIPYAWVFFLGGGFQNAYSQETGAWAIAVRDGDVAPIPEPSTYALMLAGLGCLGFIAKRRTQISI